jgi:hypothetical protein
MNHNLIMKLESNAIAALYACGRQVAGWSKGMIHGLGVAFTVLAMTLSAQDGVGPMVYTIGTTWREMPANKDWAYLLWLGSNPSLVGGQTFALYSKTGDASAAGPYKRVAIVGLQTDIRVINPLLQRAAALGENLGALDVDINALFGKFVPSNSVSGAEKISAVLRGTVGDEEHFSRMILLARLHPSVAMSLGLAHAEPIGPGITTFEIRQFDQAQQKDISVIGRVTVEAGNPTVLPPPGPPVQVPQAAARGDLNIQLRWAVPDDLRRLSLLQHGFNVWRVRRDFAEDSSRKWQLTPPAASALFSSLASTTAVFRVNQNPLLVSKQFAATNVANFDPTNGDARTVFTIDDNNRGRPGVPPYSPDFTNGASFYYFVSARDILGRDGLVSTGTPVTVCDQLPPDALTHVEVVNDYVYDIGTATTKHSLRINWQQPTNGPGSDETIVRYWIYRWTNVNEVRLLQANANANRIAIVAHNPALTQNTYLDNGPGAPAAPADLSRTFWYTVRAEDSGACGGNLSPHSGPVSGVLRDRVGPAGPTGTVRTLCVDPVLSFLNHQTNSQGATDINFFEFTVNLLRTSSRISWMNLRAEVRQYGTTNVLKNISLGKWYFPPGVNASMWNFSVSRDFSGEDLFIIGTVGTTDEQISNLKAAYQLLNIPRLSTISWDARGSLTRAKDQNCDRHEPVDPSTGLNVPIDITIIPTPTSREVKFYRRVDGGPLMLLCQKTWQPTNLVAQLCQDDSLPSSASEICYYAQLYDEHGNPSPLVKLKCLTITSPIKLPRPMLAPIEPVGTDVNPQMRLRWFCPPAGIERFEVGIATSTEQLPDDPANGKLYVSGGLQLVPIPSTVKKDSDLPLIGLMNFKPFRTPRIGNGSSFGDGPEFAVDVNIKKGIKYTAFVRAIGRDGNAGDRSNIESFFWKPPPTNTPPTVAWPARPLPNVSATNFNFNFTAMWMTNPANLFTGSVVMIGSNLWIGTEGQTVPGVGTSYFSSRPQVLRDTLDPTSYLTLNSNGISILPVALYRYQVANARFPQVAGDIVQVSPLMESIAFQRTVSNSVVHAIIHDPFVIFDGFRFNTGSLSIVYLTAWLKDTQPIIAGSRYRYLLVRFLKSGEVAEVIPTNEMEVP